MANSTPGNADQRLAQIQNLTPSALNLSTFNYTYDAEGIIQAWGKQIDSSSALTSNFTYDSADQLISASVPLASSLTPQAFRYLYDKAGNRTAEQIDSGVAAATVNNLNQVTALGSTGPLHFAGGLSEPANVTVNGVAAKLNADNSFSVDVPLAPGAHNVPVVATDGNGNTSTKTYQVSVTDSGVNRTLTYDANRNLTNDGAGKVYGYDAANRLISITQASGVTGLAYDGAGRRVQETLNGTLIKQWVWCSGAQPCEELDSSGNVTKRFYAQGEQINGAPFFFTCDHLGSVREMTDASGAIRARYDYAPYGLPTRLSGDLDSDFGFAGMYYHAASGDYMTRHRIYDPILARWTSEDPLGEEGPDGPNLYEYCSNNPINFIDPLGLADVVLISPDDSAYHGATIVPSGGPIFTVVAHGSPRGGFFADDSGTMEISRDDIISAIDKGGHKPGQPIQAYICYSGVGRNLDEMKKIAKAEASTVIVPTSAVAPLVGKKTGNFKGSEVGDETGPGKWIQVSPTGNVTDYHAPKP